jgi:hypothetical protein
VQTTAADHGEAVSFKVVFKKTTHDVTFGLQQTAGELKDHLSKLTGQKFIHSLKAAYSDFGVILRSTRCDDEIDV